jgi:hypothetical protein
MRSRVCLLVAPAVVLLGASPVAAATLQVGPGQTYTTPCAAIAAASAGDEIDIAAATYTDTCTIGTAGLHLKGVGGRPKIDVTGEEPAGMKGVYAIEADDVVIENLELMGAQISVAEGENGAGLRIQSNGVVVTNCYIHDNQNGILSGPVTGAGTGTVTIEHTELSNNGLGNGCNDGNGCTHNAYIGPYAHLIFQFNYSHSVGSDGGHLLKSRAVRTDVLYNRMTGEMGDDSYELEIAQGGTGIVVGNVFEKGPNSMNSGTSLFFCDPSDGCAAGTNVLYVANNTFVNDDGASTTFVHLGGTGMLASAHDNIFSGTGTPSSSGALSADNLSGVDPQFVAPSSYDYHLKSTSPAIGKGVAEGSAAGFPLTPVWEYVDPESAVVRATRRARTARSAAAAGGAADRRRGRGRAREEAGAAAAARAADPVAARVPRPADPDRAAAPVRTPATARIRAAADRVAAAVATSRERRAARTRASSPVSACSRSRSPRTGAVARSGPRDLVRVGDSAAERQAYEHARERARLRQPRHVEVLRGLDRRVRHRVAHTQNLRDDAGWPVAIASRREDVRAIAVSARRSGGERGLHFQGRERRAP